MAENKNLKDIQKMNDAQLEEFIENQLLELDSQITPFNIDSGANWANILGLTLKYKTKIDIASNELKERQKIREIQRNLKIVHDVNKISNSIKISGLVLTGAILVHIIIEIFKL